MPLRFQEMKQLSLVTTFDTHFAPSTVFLRKDAKGVKSMREAFKEYAQPTSLADQQENDIALAKMDIAFHYLIRKTIIEFINLCLE